ncbi:hypothetical protein ACHQM5_021218 [Ranunculus cassubicifolius]
MDSINGQDPSSSSSESRAALTIQKVYRGYCTRRRLADTAVVAEEFWWKAIDYARLNQSTVSFFDFEKPETAVDKWNRVGSNASKVGKGLNKDSKALKLAFQHWIEAIDPRHRYGHSLHFYYDEWKKADSEQPFFYWLDVGDGREVDLEVCSRSKLRKQCIKYLGPQERMNYEHIIIEGKLVNKHTGEFLDTFETEEDDDGEEKEEGMKWIYVVSTSRQLYIGKKKKGVFQHSSFLAGGVTLAAGRLVCKEGELKSISAYSGHYRPTEQNLDTFLALLQENGLNLAEVEINHSDDYGHYGDSISNEEENSNGVLTNDIDITQEMLEDQESKSSEVAQKTQVPKVPKDKILHRMNSKKVVNSYQLGHQLAMKWSTGTGPRIGCVADYPIELRLQALEFVNLSPRTSRKHKSLEQLGGLVAPTPHPTSDPVVVV